jgi:hypothetical protein
LTRLGGYEGEGRGTGRAAVIVAPSAVRVGTAVHCAQQPSTHYTPIEEQSRYQRRSTCHRGHRLRPCGPGVRPSRGVVFQLSRTVVTKETTFCHGRQPQYLLPGLPSDGIHVQIGSQLPGPGTWRPVNQRGCEHLYQRNLPYGFPLGRDGTFGNLH